MHFINFSGRVISTKKEDLMVILDQFNIQVISLPKVHMQEHWTFISHKKLKPAHIHCMKQKVLSFNALKSTIITQDFQRAGAHARNFTRAVDCLHKPLFYFVEERHNYLKVIMSFSWKHSSCVKIKTYSIIRIVTHIKETTCSSAVMIAVMTVPLHCLRKNFKATKQNNAIMQ